MSGGRKKDINRLVSFVSLSDRQGLHEHRHSRLQRREASPRPEDLR
jgi:hypothetical protein